MDACKTLKDYSIFVAKIRKYAKIMSIEEAVKIAIDECINEDILADFLRKQRAEVFEMSILEYNEELHLKNVHQDGYEEGVVKGEAKGKKTIDRLYSWLKDLNRTDDIIRAVGNESVQEELLEEYRKAHDNSEK
jgi:hypothetical protein